MHPGGRKLPASEQELKAAIAAHGSMTKAGRAFGASAAAVSKALARYRTRAAKDRQRSPRRQLIGITRYERQALTWCMGIRATT